MLKTPKRLTLKNYHPYFLSILTGTPMYFWRVGFNDAEKQHIMAEIEERLENFLLKERANKMNPRARKAWETRKANK